MKRATGRWKRQLEDCHSDPFDFAQDKDHGQGSVPMLKGTRLCEILRFTQDGRNSRNWFPLSTAPGDLLSIQSKETFLFLP